MFYPLLGDSFVFAKGDETWKARRKALSHVFYKDRISDMVHTLKDILAGKCEKWAAATRQNNGKTVIDISTEFQEIFARNLLTIILGEDISEELVEINVIGDGKEFKL